MMNLFMIELTVAHLGTSMAWYCDRFALTVALFDAHNHFALLDGPQVKLALKQGSPLAGTTTIFFRTPNLDETVREFAKRGTQPSGPIKQSSEGYRQVVVLDPDGHRIGVFEWAADMKG